jgi:hypothetical protein
MGLRCVVFASRRKRKYPRYTPDGYGAHPAWRKTSSERENFGAEAASLQMARLLLLVLRAH